MSRPLTLTSVALLLAACSAAPQPAPQAAATPAPDTTNLARKLQKHWGAMLESVLRDDRQADARQECRRRSGFSGVRFRATGFSVIHQRANPDCLFADAASESGNEASARRGRPLADLSRTVGAMPPPSSSRRRATRRAWTKARMPPSSLRRGHVADKSERGALRACRSTG